MLKMGDTINFEDATASLGKSGPYTYVSLTSKSEVYWKLNVYLHPDEGYVMVAKDSTGARVNLDDDGSIAIRVGLVNAPHFAVNIGPDGTITVKPAPDN
jgi:hypothetical protein